MSKFKSPSVIALHAIALVSSLALAILSGQNPRIIIYALIFGLIWRFLTAWLMTAFIRKTPELVFAISREPLPHEKLRRNKNPHTGKYFKEGFFSYLFGILTMAFMIGVLQYMGNGPGFIKSNILIPEVLWGLGISVLYWVEDIVTNNIIIHPQKDVSDNLNYNSGGYKFLLASIFISQAFILGAMVIILLLGDLGLVNEMEHGAIPVEWILILVLAFLKFAYEIRLPKKPRRLPG